MSKNTRVGMIAAAALFLAIFVGWCLNKPAKAGEAENGVKIIPVTNHSFYVVDERYNLCFYETQTVNGVAVVTIMAGCYDLIRK